MTIQSDISPKHPPKQYELLTSRLGKRIREEMARQNIDQASLAGKIGQSQAAISNIITGKTNVSMKTVFLAMEALEMDPLKELEYCSRDSSHAPARNLDLFSKQLREMTRDFISSPSCKEFNGQLGTFHIYFHSTNSHENKVLHGTLELRPIDGQCLATLDLICNKDAEDADDGHKLYTGAAFISLPQQAVYILLASNKLSELCFLIYPYNRILSARSSLECTMAISVTISAGIDSRLPTAHRIFLSRRKLDEKSIHLIRGQLLLNKSMILISKEAFEEMRTHEHLHSEFLHYIMNHCDKGSYYAIEEIPFKNLTHNGKTSYFHDLCILRSYSSAPKNNKINPQVIAKIYHEIVNKLSDDGSSQ